MAIKLKEIFISLGPVFVKFGQILSTRPDLLPTEYITELEKLQAFVPPFGFKDAKKIIEQNLGKPLNKIFKTFETEPFAAASLGQVYKATLPGGEKVAVKVQRPKAKTQIKLDTQVLLTIAHLIDNHVVAAKGYNLTGVVQEFRRWTLNELDYRKEATNCEIFSNFFKDDPHIYGPKVYWEYSGDSVLTLEYIDGYSLGDIISGKAEIKTNKKQLARFIADSFIRQFFKYGYFHADPHPGNIFILSDKHILFLDFGMVGFLDENLTNIGAGFFIALVQKDVEGMVNLLLKIEENYDEEADKKDIRDIVQVNKLRKELNNLVLQWSITGKAGNFTRMLFEILNIAIKNGINIPTDLTMLSKSIITLDVVVKNLDPEFDMALWEKPMVEKIITKKLAVKNIKNKIQNTGLILEELFQKLPDSTANIVRNIERGRFGMEINTEQLTQYERLLNANSKINTYAILLAATVIASALIYQVKGQPEIFGFSVAQLGLYGSMILILLYFISNLKKGK